MKYEKEARNVSSKKLVTMEDAGSTHVGRIKVDNKQILNLLNIRSTIFFVAAKVAKKSLNSDEIDKFLLDDCRIMQIMLHDLNILGLKIQVKDES